MRRTFLEILLLAALIFLSYRNIFHNGYVWDDHFQIENNPYTSQIHNIPLLYTEDTWKLFRPETGSVGYWRPFVFSTYAIDQFLPISKPLVHHLVDLLFYLLCSIAVLKWIRELVSDPNASLLATVGFVLWPLHTEAVTFMQGRGFSITATLWIGTSLLIRKYWFRGNIKSLIGSGILFFLALLSYEISIVLPIFIGLMLFQSDHLQRLKSTLSVFVLVAVFYLALRTFIAPVRTYSSALLFKDAWMNMGGVTLRLVRGLIWPYEFTIVPDPPPVVSTFIDAILGMVLLASGWLTLVYLFIRRSVWVLPLGLVLLSTLLVLAPWPRGSLYQDRYVFLPSIGTALALALLLKRWPKNSLKLLMVCWFLSFVPTIWARNLDWQDDISLWCREAERYPTSFHGNQNCGWALHQKEKYDEALTYYDKALSIRMDENTANDYAIILGQKGRCDEAVKIFEGLRMKNQNFEIAKKNEELCRELLRSPVKNRR